MGILPLQFRPGESITSLELTGRETFYIDNVADQLLPGAALEVRAVTDDGIEQRFTTLLRLDTANEIACFRSGGIMNAILYALAA
jgi:aconitate hydratase